MKSHCSLFHVSYEKVTSHEHSRLIQILFCRVQDKSNSYVDDSFDSLMLLLPLFYDNDDEEEEEEDDDNNEDDSGVFVATLYVSN